MRTMLAQQLMILFKQFIKLTVDLTFQGIFTLFGCQTKTVKALSGNNLAVTKDNFEAFNIIASGAVLNCFFTASIIANGAADARKVYARWIGRHKAAVAV